MSNSYEDFLDSLRVRFQNCTCSVQQFEKEGKLSLEDFQHSIVVIDCDKYKIENKYSSKISDNLLFWCKSDLGVAVVEKKSESLKFSDVRKQIQNGAKISEEMVKDIKIKPFLPILIHQAKKPIELWVLRGHQIIFQDKTYLIIPKERGANLSKIMQESAVGV